MTSRTARIASRFRPGVEMLEGREVPTGTISISDAMAIEGSSSLKVIDRFVVEGSGGLDRPRGLVFGPDGNSDGAQDLYVASADTNQILRFDGQTGSFMDAFVAAGSGGLISPFDLAFGPDNMLYVSSYSDGKVLRYDALTGTFVDIIASGLSGPVGLSFGNDGSLFIAAQESDEVLRYDGSGLSIFVSAGSGGLDQPRQALIGPDGNLYVASQGTKQVLRYDGLTGAFIDEFTSTNVMGLGAGPAWLEFGADGYLYTTARTTPADNTVGFKTSIVRFDALSGAFVDSFAMGRDGWSFIVGPDGFVYDSANGAGNFIDRIGASSIAAFAVSLDSPSAVPVTVDFTTATGSAIAGTDFLTTSGTLTFAPGQTTQTILVQTLDDAIGEPTETFTVNLSNPVGATIADGIAIATILDNETKFFVVDDATTNVTYEYATSGNALENYSLNSANSAPRGAASTAAGDKVWVVDANKKVYVYNPSGTLLGSWTAGSLASNATVEGIATNGTDVWLVDARQDKIFRYTGAATRLSGSQNAASSFNLNSGNSSPKDVVTDGSSLWVVNDASTNKVFKYNLTGTLLGSWTIDNSNATPTGITLDPTNVNHLWIVDSGTDRVYQYDGATSRTSGSQAASTSFALAAGNTNPQGIADPPVARSTTKVRLPKVKAPKADVATIDALFAMDALGSKRVRARLA